MTEDDARDWLLTRFGVVAFTAIEAFLGMVIAENERQNLLSPASMGVIWSRHAADSAQLLDRLPARASRWVDIGTGGGFPGMIAAILFDGEVMMVEPRKRRVAFLRDCIDRFGMGSTAQVTAAKIEHTAWHADVISARAVSSVENVLRASAHCATSGTRWILPRGRRLEEDLPVLAGRFGVMFHVEHSITDSASIVLLADRI